MTSFETRAVRPEDLDSVVRLLDEADRALGVPSHPVREDLRWVWNLPTTDLERDTRLVFDQAALVGYGEAIWKHPDDGGPLELHVRVDRTHEGADVEAGLFAWGEGVARERGANMIRTLTDHEDAVAGALLQGRGYDHVRSSFTMAKELGPAEGAGTPPAGVTIRPYADADERSLYEVHQASFAEDWEFRPTSLENFNAELHGEDWDPSLVFVADADGTLVGHVITFLFETCGFVGMLGVLKDWRGRGVATALLKRSFAELAKRGVPEVRLGVDAQNPTGAVRLYESIGMRVHRRFDTYELESA